MIVELNDSEECGDIRSTLTALLDKRARSEQVRAATESDVGFDQKFLAELAELGFTTLGVPESAGGLGLGIAECAVAWHEWGRRLLPGPAGSTLAAGLILAEASAANRLAEGASCAVARWSPGADRLRFVPHGDRVDLVLAVAEDRVVLVEGFTGSPTPALDPTRRLAEVDLTDATVTEVGGTELARRADALVLAWQAVEAAGAAVRALELSVHHLLLREQFGRPLGSFQALKHRCADLVVGIRGAYAMAQAALRRPGEVEKAMVARLVAADTLFEVAAEAIQLHGGIGITWEHDIQLYLKRAKSTQLLWRTQSDLRRRLAGPAGLADFLC